MYLNVISQALRGIFVKQWVNRRELERRSGQFYAGIDLRQHTRRSETFIKTRYGSVHVCGVCGSSEAIGNATLYTATQSKQVSACVKCDGKHIKVSAVEYEVLPMLHTEAWRAELAERDLL